MIIHYHPNPLQTVVELDAYDLEKLRLKLMIEDLQDRIYGAHLHLEPGKYYDVAAAIRSLDVNSLEEAPFERKIDRLLDICVEELRGQHIGDCTCQPCSCMKCHAERLLGIDTIEGLGKHAAHKIDSAFATERSLNEVIASLEDYKPVRGESWSRFPQEDFDRHIPRWTEEARHAAAWLRAYRDRISSTLTDHAAPYSAETDGGFGPSRLDSGG
jgi:hypothetical protein